MHDRNESVTDIDALATTYTDGDIDVTDHRDMSSERMLPHPLSAPMTLRWS